MQILFLFFLLLSALLTGCGSTNYMYSSKKITVYRTNGITDDYSLLSLRGDSAIVVLDWAENKVYPIPYAHAEMLIKESINRIVRAGQGGGERSTIGALSGAVLGGLAGYLLSPKPPKSENYLEATFNNFLFVIFDMLFIGLGSGGGALTGVAIGNAFPPSMEISLSSAKDREFLRSISLYPDKEPIEMQYIK